MQTKHENGNRSPYTDYLVLILWALPPANIKFVSINQKIEDTNNNNN